MATFTILYAPNSGTLTGTSKDERLIGRDSFVFGDTIYGGSEIDPILGVNRFFGDLIEGRKGEDLLNGERGLDTVYGGVGNDEIHGGRKGLSVQFTPGVYTPIGYPLQGSTFEDGNDLLYGDDGNDRIYGGNGQDYLYGGTGNDRLYGGEDTITLNGNGGDYLDGNDYLDGGAGNDYLDGENGDDVLRGGFGYDILIANSAADNVNLSPQIDILTGGAEPDWFSFEKPPVGVVYYDPNSGALDSQAPGVDRITDFTYGEDKFLLKASTFGNLTQDPSLQYYYTDPITGVVSGTDGVGHVLAASIYPNTRFYRLHPDEFTTVPTIADLGTLNLSSDKVVLVVQAEAPYTGAPPATYFPALFYSDGIGYTEFAVLTNGAVPINEIITPPPPNNIPVLHNDFIIY